MRKYVSKPSKIFRFIGVFALITLTEVVASQGQSAPAQPAAAPQQNPANAEVHILQIRENVYMLVGAGGNITMQIGDDGVVLVDSGLASMSDKVLAAMHSITAQPLRYIINTHVHADHTGGNAAIGKTGSTVTGGNVVGNIGASAGEGATIIAYQTVQDRMSTPGSKDAAPSAAWPTDTYSTPRKDMFINGEAVVILHEPAAHTDGDSVVFFRRSDVVSTGDVFTTTMYPFIDIERGGSIQGELDALNQLIFQLAVPGPEEEGGTMIVPGHGRLCNQADVTTYQEMVTIIRDRIQKMIDKGFTLEQVKAAKPTSDYDPRYGATTGFWTTDKFVEAVYTSLKSAKH